MTNLSDNPTYESLYARMQAIVARREAGDQLPGAPMGRITLAATTIPLCQV